MSSTETTSTPASAPATEATTKQGITPTTPQAVELAQTKEQKMLELVDDLDLDTLPDEIKAKLFKAKKKFTVNGKEKSMTLAELLRSEQKEYGANHKFEEATKMTAAAKQLVELLQNNPVEALRLANHDPEMLAKQLLSQKIQLESMSEAEREALTYKEKLAYYEKKEKEQQEALESQKKAQLLEQRKNYWETEIVKAMEKRGLPKDPDVLAYAANYLLEAKRREMRGLDTGFSMDDIMDQVEEHFSNQAKTFLSKTSVEKLLKTLPKEQQEALRQAFIQSVAPQVAPEKSAGPKASEKKPKKMGMQEWKEYIASK